MSDENVVMLDVILKNMQKLEDHISATKKRLHEVQEASLQDQREYAFLVTKNKELEESIKKARLSYATINTRLRSSQLLLHNLKTELAKEEEQQQQLLRELDAECSREVEAAGACSEALLRDHCSSLRLDNPAIPARREAMAQELAQLRMEETRQSCEIKVLEDIDKEREKLEKQIKREKEETEALRRELAGLKEKTAAVERKIAQMEKLRDELQQCPIEEQEEVVGLQAKLRELQQEGDYLVGGIEAMKKELRQLEAQRGLEGASLEGITDSQQSTAYKRRARGRDVDSGGTEMESSAKKGRTATSFSSLPSTSTSSLSTSFRMPPHSQEHAHSSAMDVDESLDEMLRDINWTTDIDLSDTHTQSEQERNRSSGGEKKVSTSDPAPSTPRIFTRNPAPPTPNSEAETRPLLKHILANTPQAPPLKLRAAAPAPACPQPTPRLKGIHVRPPVPDPSLYSSIPSSSFPPAIPNHLSSSCPSLRLPFPFLSQPQRVQQMTVTSTLQQVHPCPSSSSTSNLVSTQPLPKTEAATATTLQQPSSSSSSGGPTITFMQRSGAPLGTYTGGMVRPTNQETFNISQGIKGVHFSSLASAMTPRLHPPTTAPNTLPALGLALSALTVRGQQRPQQQQQRPQQQLQRPQQQQQLQRPWQQQQMPQQQLQKQRPWQQQQRPQQQQQQQRPRLQQQEPHQQQKSHQQQKRPWQQQHKPHQQKLQQHRQRPQQVHRFRQWQEQKGLNSPTKRRIRFNELTEVLGTPESDSGQ